jgi:hypothetical protein
MESAAAPDVATRSHHSARSYVPGGGNDPSLQARNAEPSTSNVQKREEEVKSTWRREKLPRHVRDTMTRKRDNAPNNAPPLPRSEPEKVTRATPSEVPPVDVREEKAPRAETTNTPVQTREENTPRAETTNNPVQTREENTPRAETTNNAPVEAREESKPRAESAPSAPRAVSNDKPEKREPIRPIAAFRWVPLHFLMYICSLIVAPRRALESLD